MGGGVSWKREELKGIKPLIMRRSRGGTKIPDRVSDVEER